jgi:hypothetical protein
MDFLNLKTSKIFYLVLIFAHHFIVNAQCVSGDCQNGYGTYKFGDGGLYEGNFQNGLENGNGVLKYPSGSIYKGEFKNGKLFGKGSKKYINGDILEGDFVNDECISGSYIYTSGTKFVGSFSKSMPSNGTYIWPNGDKYVGNISNMNLEGDGIKILKNGEIIEGAWSNGKLIKKKEPSPINSNLINNIVNKSKEKNGDLLSSIKFDIPTELLERKKNIDKAFLDLKKLLKTSDSLKVLLDLYKPIFTSELDVQTYKSILDNDNLIYVLKQSKDESYNDKIKKLNKIMPNSNYWINNSIIIFQDKKNEIKESEFLSNYSSKFYKNKLFYQKEDKKRFKIIKTLINKYGDEILLKNDNRADFAKKITGLDQNYFDVFNLKHITDGEIDRFLNNYKIVLNSNYFYFGDKSNNLANGFGYLFSNIITDKSPVLVAKWEKGYPIKIIELNLYEGIHSTAEIPSLDLKKINGNNRLLIDYKGFIMGEHNGKNFDGNVFRVWKDGNYFIGKYNNGSRIEGNVFFTEGSFYTGSFDENGRFSNNGTYNWSDGSTYNGQWLNNTRTGYGIFKNNSGRNDEGIWDNDIFVKSKETIEKENKEIEKQREAEYKRIEEQRIAEEKSKQYNVEDALTLLATLIKISNKNKHNYSVQNDAYNSRSKTNNLNSNNQNLDNSKICSLCNKIQNKQRIGSRCEIKVDKVSNPGYIVCPHCRGIGFEIGLTKDCDCPNGIGSCPGKLCYQCEGSGWYKCSSCYGKGVK